MNCFKSFRMRWLIALLGLLGGAGGLTAAPRAQRAEMEPTRAAVASPVATAQVVQCLREHFNFRADMKVSIEPLQTSKIPGFFETTVLVDNGKEDTSQTVYVTKDGSYVALGALFVVGTDATTEILRRAREYYRVPEATVLTAGPLVDSKYPRFQQIKVSTSAGKSQVFFVARDTHVLVLGHVLPLDAQQAKAE